MAQIKLTKSAVDAAQAQAQPVELRDTLVPGFMCKVTAAPALPFERRPAPRARLAVCRSRERMRGAN